MSDTLSDMRRFLDASFYNGTEHSPPDLTRGRFPFVTVSREYGAGGHHLARTLLEHLDAMPETELHGWKIFDRDLCESLIADPQLRDSIDSLLSEEYRTEVESLVYSLLGRASPQPAAINQLFNFIRTLATFGKVVIVGRAGAAVTGSLPLGVHVRLAAPLGFKIHRARLDRISRDEALRIVKRKDSARAKLVKNHFQRDITDPCLYDMVLNTERVPFSFIAETTALLVRKRWNERKLEPAIRRPAR
ncbi:MAG: cytidylate kinase-like family protein [Acidobacteriota bacterium]|nr:MAG: cytidylate kinase-like family protein [Acidobacteriota bacterium]